MELLEQDRGILWVRLEKGEKVIETLQSLAIQNKIPSAYLIGLGAVCNARLGFYHLEKKQYQETQIAQDCELVNLTGNISWKESAPVVHAHVTLGLSNFEVRAGHLFEAEVAVTVEIGLQLGSQKVARVWDENVGLFLQKFMIRNPISIG